jgi:hypothetical protein
LVDTVPIANAVVARKDTITAHADQIIVPVVNVNGHLRWRRWIQQTRVVIAREGVALNGAIGPVVHRDLRVKVALGNVNDQGA